MLGRFWVASPEEEGCAALGNSHGHILILTGKIEKYQQMMLLVMLCDDSSSYVKGKR